MWPMSEMVDSQFLRRATVRMGQPRSQATVAATSVHRILI